MFCPKCGSVLLPKKEGSKKVLVCSCGYKSGEVEKTKITETVDKKEKEIDVEVISREKTKQFLRVDLTEKEMMDAAKSTSGALLRITRLKGDLAGISKRFKADIEAEEITVRKNSELVENGYEYRDVDCEWIKNWAKGLKSLIRNDTNKMVHADVKIESSERQSEIQPSKDEKEVPF